MPSTMDEHAQATLADRAQPPERRDSRRRSSTGVTPVANDLRRGALIGPASQILTAIRRPFAAIGPGRFEVTVIVATSSAGLTGRSSGLPRERRSRSPARRSTAGQTALQTPGQWSRPMAELIGACRISCDDERRHEESTRRDRRALGERWSNRQERCE